METPLTQALTPRKLPDLFLERKLKGLSSVDAKKMLRQILKAKRTKNRVDSPLENWGNRQSQRALSFLYEPQNTPSTIASYLPIGSEWDPNLLRTNSWIFPKMQEDRSLLWFSFNSAESQTLVKTRFDIAEKSFEECFEFSEILGAVLMFVPCLAVDKKGYRLGYGGGYYDTHLAKFKHKIVSVCTVTDEFFFDSLPYESHDVPVDVIVTESSIYLTKPLNQVLCKLRT